MRNHWSTQMSTKPSRNVPDSDSYFHRTIKKRASQACHQCRLRKIRCDLVATGPPCNNCQFDGTECTTLVSKRSRTYRLQKSQLTQSCASQRPLLAQIQPPGPTLCTPPTAEGRSEAE